MSDAFARLLCWAPLVTAVAIAGRASYPMASTGARGWCSRADSTPTSEISLIFREWARRNTEISTQKREQINGLDSSNLLLSTSCESADSGHIMTAVVAYPSRTASWYRWIVPIKRGRPRLAEAELARYIVD